MKRTSKYDLEALQSYRDANVRESQYAEAINNGFAVHFAAIARYWDAEIHRPATMGIQPNRHK